LAFKIERELNANYCRDLSSEQHWLKKSLYLRLFICMFVSFFFFLRSNLFFCVQQQQQSLTHICRVRPHIDTLCKNTCLSIFHTMIGRSFILFSIHRMTIILHAHLNTSSCKFTIYVYVPINKSLYYESAKKLNKNLKNHPRYWPIFTRAYPNRKKSLNTS
jgi:hypothetical protein